MFFRNSLPSARRPFPGARPSTQFRGRRLRLFEQLESRCVLSCTASIDPTTNALLITGDNGANRIEVQDEGPAGVSVTCDGKVLIEGAIVDSVVFKTLGGPDTIDYQLGPFPGSTEPGYQRVLDVNTGGGSDRFTATFNALIGLLINAELAEGHDVFELNIPSASAGGDLSLLPAISADVNGAAGNDTFRVNVGDVNVDPQNPNLPHVKAFQLDFAGGSGADAFLIGLLNVAIDGPVAINLNGGEGSDRFTQLIQKVDFESGAHIGVDSGIGADQILLNLLEVRASGGGGDRLGGVLSLDLLGRDGNDLVSMSVNDLEIELQAFVDLGAGLDFFFAYFQGDEAPAAFEVFGQDGNDLVRASFSEMHADLSLDVNLGRGNDTTVIGIIGPEAMMSGDVNAPPPATDINVGGGEGTDRLSLNFRGQVSGPLDVNLSGQDGSDELSLNLSPEYFVEAAAQLTLDGGRGNDRLSYIDFCKVRGGSLTVDLLGGEENDFLNSLLSGRLTNNAAVKLTLDGQDGNDNIDAAVQLAATNDYSLLVHVLGNRGNDNLGLRVFGASSQNNLLDLLLDGGGGRDKGNATPNVRVNNIEK